ncbi:radical SAM protein [Propionispira raffinosivorans]|uniref:radical SAM protein n=1 Tax=Propionispira raffinosivorans TaxID=86959 RepID=UPI00035F8C15|nr:radical SAM protein [Propionispira raffinosivorans]
MIDKARIREIHPCFGAKQNKGRMHLPVCPGCNIECNFCDRKINTTENRPGVTASILKPEQAIAAIERGLKLCPDITVAGIAGPGDTLATDNALSTFRLIHDKFPQLLKCMSTNGLLLNERAEEIIDVGIDTLTVTVNAVDPEIQAKIISGIVYHGKRYEGMEAADILIKNQLAGIRKIADAGITIKINTVLINEINRFHIKEVARQVKAAGATLYNIIPLIPQHKLKDCVEPGCNDIDGVRREAEKYIDVFRHCQRCRADAVGVPGESNFSEQVYLGQLVVKETFSHG